MENEKCDLVIKNAKFINVFTEELEEGDIGIIDDTIIGIGNYSGEIELDCTGKIISPGFIDCHLHIESSMVTPEAYGEIALKNGVTSIVADPHEIANVLGEEGIEFMLQSSQLTALNIYFMVPSCVPAVSFEENGGKLTADKLIAFKNNEKVLGLGEVMDVPAVTSYQEEMIAKLYAFKDKCIDGHAPRVTGKQLNQYILSGITTDHECSSEKEALEKLSRGMYILIREGSAAKNLKDLIGAVNDKNFRRFALCTDDRHVEDILEKGTINYSIKKCINNGIDPIKAYIMGTFNGYNIYGLKKMGAIAPGYKADLVILDSLREVKINKVIKSGKVVNNKIKASKLEAINTMNIEKIEKETFNIRPEGEYTNIIEVIPHSLETNHIIKPTKIKDGYIAFNEEEDILKVGVFERHKYTGHYALGFIKGLGLKNCAIAQSVAHDSHNIIVVGDNEEDMTKAVNTSIDIGGGIVLVSKGKILESLSLEIGGLMTNASINYVYDKVKSLNEGVKKLGLKEGIDPFITLSFMSLPVIPSLKLTTKGLFSYEKFTLIPLSYNK